MESLEGARSERDRCHLLRGKEVCDKPCLIEDFCEDSIFQKESKGIRHVYCKLRKSNEIYFTRGRSIYLPFLDIQIIYFSSVIVITNEQGLQLYLHNQMFDVRNLNFFE